MQNAGQIVYHASIDTGQFKRDAGSLDRIAEGSASGVEKKGMRMSSAMTAFKVVGVAAVAAVGVAIVKNLGGAIARLDTLDNSARVFANLGFSAEDTGKAMGNLDQSIRGLPTRLNDAVLGVQALAASTGDVGRGQKIFESLNNAVLGLGGTSQDVDSAVLAMSRAMDSGKLQGREWQMMITSGLGPALNNLAKEMGMTTGELQEGLSKGTISVEEFESALLDANKNGAGSMASFQQMAKDSTAGISTSWANMNTAIVRGLANLIDSIGTDRITGAISVIGASFESMFKIVAKVISAVADWAEKNPQLTKVILIAAAAIAGIVVVIGILGILLPPIIAGFKIVGVVIAAVASPIGLAVLAIGALVAALVYAYHNSEEFREIVNNAFTVVKEHVTTAIGFVREAIAAFVEFGKRVWENWGDLIIEYTMNAFNTIKAVLEGAFQVIQGILQVFTGVFSGDWSKVWDGVKNIFGGAWNVITGLLRGVFNNIWIIIRAAFRGWLMAVKNSFNQTVGFVRSLPGRILGALGNLGGLLVNSGKALLRGFVDGIKSMANAPVEAVKGMVGRVRNLLPFSPAKEGPFSGKGWVEYSGLAISESLAGGIIKGTQSAVSAAQGLMTDLSTSLSPGLATVPSMASGGGSGQSVVNNINRIDIANDVDGENWLRKLGREEEIIEKGLTRG